MRFNFRRLLSFVGISKMSASSDRKEAVELPMNRYKGVPKEIIGAPRLTRATARTAKRELSSIADERKCPRAKRLVGTIKHRLKQVRATRRRAVAAGVPVSKRRKRRSLNAARAA